MGAAESERGAGPTPPSLHVVLHEPEIPNNTGTIGRTCVAIGAALHLIHPIGFEITEHACRRAGLDYWPRLFLREHGSWENYLSRERPGRVWLFSAKARRTLFEADFRRGDHLVFGRESKGLPDTILWAHADRALSIPMLAGERSLNLANAASVAAYEAVRQMIGRGEMVVDSTGRVAPASEVSG
ncbi:MAG: tRNA (cytidine(34)-2'-O)-methyltransferase [Phycisphaerales bacterium]|nr:tRNA (cytidine(34)-2'-O)-methyltransferase [Phycisphaerales bacterium]